jgi:tetratricopeptide (TPR) repeat protein
LLFAAASVVLATVTADGAPAGGDDEIAFYQDRIARDPGDFMTPVRLGAAYLRKAHATGDPSLAARAVAASERSLTLMPDHVPALVVLSSARSAQHRFPDALDAARRASELDAENPDVWAVLGDAQLNLGALAAARAAYEHLHARAPGLGSFARLAEWRQATGDDAGALADWERANSAGIANGAPPADLAWAHAQRGALHFARGRFKEADSDYEAARRLDREGDAIEERIAELRAAEGRYVEAEQLYERIAARVIRPDLQQTIGDFFVSIGKTEKARLWHQRAEAAYRRSADGGEVLYLHHLASFCADVRSLPAEAVMWARKDLALRQTSGAYDVLAWTLYKNEEIADARVAIDRALAVSAADPHVLQHAALIYAADGASAAGVSLLRKAYVLNPQLDRFHAHH